MHGGRHLLRQVVMSKSKFCLFEVSVCKTDREPLLSLEWRRGKQILLYIPTAVVPRHLLGTMRSREQSSDNNALG